MGTAQHLALCRSSCARQERWLPSNSDSSWQRAALLAEALQLALPHEGRQPNVHVADAVAEVVGAELAHIAGAVLDLHGMNVLTRAAYIRQSAAVYRLQQPVVERPAPQVLGRRPGRGHCGSCARSCSQVRLTWHVNGRAVVCDLLGLGD